MSLVWLARRKLWDRHANSCAVSKRGEERDRAAELLCHKIMYDVEAESGIALCAPGGEKRVEYVTLNVVWNAASVIHERDLDLALADATRFDVHMSFGRIVKCVSDGVKDKVGQHAPIGTRMAI
jgi:hypothetical protein